MPRPILHIPAIAEIVQAALDLKGASLVIFRHKTLIEFKTEKLGQGLSLYEEHGHVSWQIGAFDGHHCHLDVGACTQVIFGAEPVSCQGGRLNYTVWFLVEGDCGNPYRSNAYFSVTLNQPYGEDGLARMEVIEPVFELYGRFRDNPSVSAEPAFLRAMEDSDWVRVGGRKSRRAQQEEKGYDVRA